MKKVWNITDHPGSKVSPSALMLFGKRVMPGRYVKVDPSQLKNAHKTMKDIESGLVYIGDKLPDSYTAAKGMAHARLPKGHVRSHGEQAVSAAPKKLASKIKRLVTEKPAAPPPEEKNGKSKKIGK